MNLEAMIKVLFVDSLNRRAFRTALPLFEFLVGSTTNGMPVPRSCERLVKAFKERKGTDAERRLYTFDKLELMCALTNVVVEGGVKATTNDRVIYVSHATSYLRNLTDNPKHLRNAYSMDATTRSCVEAFDEVVDSLFERLVPAVFRDAAGHSHRVLLNENQKMEMVGDGDRKFMHRHDSVEAKTGRFVNAYNSIADARTAASGILGALVVSLQTETTKLPSVPPGMKGDMDCIGKWAAAIISKKPEARVEGRGAGAGLGAAATGGGAVGGSKTSKTTGRFDSRRPRLGMTEQSAAGSAVLIPAGAKKPRTNPIAAAALRSARSPSTTLGGRSTIEREHVMGLGDTADDDGGVYDSFNEGFSTTGKTVAWSGRSKKPRRKPTARSRRGGGGGTRRASSSRKGRRRSSSSDSSNSDVSPVQREEQVKEAPLC